MTSELANPRTGERLIVRRGPRETEAHLLEIQAYLPRGWRDYWSHFHPFQEERIEILAGELTAEIDGRSRIYRAGESLIVPPGLPHLLSTSAQDPVLFLWQFRPALDTEQLFAFLYGPAAWRRIVPGGAAKVLLAAILAQDFVSEIRLVRPPIWVRPSLTRLLARAGRLLTEKAARSRSNDRQTPST